MNAALSSPGHVRLRRWLVRAGPIFALIVVYVLFASLRFDRFVTWVNTAIMLQQTAVIGVGAIGMTLVIISGGIDLSPGSVIAVSSVVVALLLQHGCSPLVAAMGGIGIGALAGLGTGVLITRLQLMPFIVTLGTMGILRGAAKGLSGEQPIYPDETWLNGLMKLQRHNLPAAVWIMLALAGMIAWMLRYTKFGRHIFAIGSNEQTARLCGIHVDTTKIFVYVLATAFAGLAGVLQFSYLTCGDPTTAVGLELNIIAAVVIGGASLAGGSGTVTGTIIGGLIMTVVNNGCAKMDMPNWVQEIVTGFIIVAAVTLDRLRRKAR